MNVRVPVVLTAVLMCACASTKTQTSTSASGEQRPVACSQLETLRGLRREMSLSTNPRTGHSLEYIVIGDGAKSNELILMFNGTGGVFADWPTQMITNKAQSPKIARTLAYRSDEDGPSSLCHDYRLVLFDYPNVGEGKATGAATFDQVADDVDAMLANIGSQYGIATNDVSLVGWSLGTLAAMKYAFLSPVARPERKIHDAILIATKAGGATDGYADGNGAQCVSAGFEALKSPTIGKKAELDLKVELFKLTFPYGNQAPYDGLDSGCTATLDSSTFKYTLNVQQPACGLGTECRKQLDDYVLNRITSPWEKTQGVSKELYVQQRELVNDWNYCYCSTASAGFKSSGCSCSKPTQISDTNGGVCQSRSGELTRNAPSSSNCVRFAIDGKLTVINGKQDLFIQWTYGKALVEAYQQAYGKEKAVLLTYPGSDGAGHGVLMQHPRWTQEQIITALQNRPAATAVLVRATGRTE